MSSRPSSRLIRTGLAALSLAAVAGTVGFVVSQPSTPAEAGPRRVDWDRDAFRGQVEVVPARRTTDSAGTGSRVLRGRVFVDRDRDSHLGRGDRGLRKVLVSNGKDVVTTDARGRYALPVRDNMTVFVTQPAGYQVPVDDNNVAQFAYHHLPQGSPELRYGGIAPTGPVPGAVNFPLVTSRETAAAEQGCVIAGDLQPYDTDEVGYARRGAIADLAQRDDYGSCGALFIGDVVGDDLSLYGDVRELSGELNGPVRFLPGNHDLDYDAPTAAHSFDTFRAQLAPAYYSYDVGQTHVVALNTVRYPCAPECDEPEDTPSYDGRLDEDQLAWLAEDLARVPEDRLVVVASHIPLLSFADEGSGRHQVEQLREVYALLEGREAVAVAGHTHTVENMRTGDLFKGWRDLFGIAGLPFPHIVAGAIAGDWYSGAVSEKGYPLAVGRDGARPGILTLDIDGTSFEERYTVTGEDDDLQLQLGVNSPTYREWYVARQAWNRTRTGVAPELTQPSTVDREDLAGTTWLTTNFWMGATGSTVEVRVDGGPARPAVRTQQARGEGQRVGPEWSDPVAVAQQLVHGGSLADRMLHLWRTELPADLAPGRHEAVVTATDSHGRTFTETIAFEVRENR